MDAAIRSHGHGGRPSISLVTSVLDDREALERTLSATLPAIAGVPGGAEWIVADGGSSDGTTALLEARSGDGLSWIGGPDLGIYDAWNKALELARGRWILFLGAGDEVSGAWLRRLAVEPDDVGFVYGDLRLRVGARTIIRRGRPWELARGRAGDGMPIPHVATAHARRLFERERFDADFRILGDWEFLLRQLGQGGRYLPIEQGTMELGGVSNGPAQRRRRREERARIWQRYGLRPSLRRRMRLGLGDAVSAVPGLWGPAQALWHRLRSEA